MEILEKRFTSLTVKQNESNLPSPVRRWYLDFLRSLTRWVCVVFSTSASTSRQDSLYPETIVWLGDGCHVTLRVFTCARTFSSVGANITGHVKEWDCFSLQAGRMRDWGLMWVIRYRSRHGSLIYYVDASWKHYSKGQFRFLFCIQKILIVSSQMLLTRVNFEVLRC